jgi:hypothetical protein
MCTGCSWLPLARQILLLHCVGVHGTGGCSASPAKKKRKKLKQAQLTGVWHLTAA